MEQSENKAGIFFISGDVQPTNPCTHMNSEQHYLDESGLQNMTINVSNTNSDLLAMPRKARVVWHVVDQVRRRILEAPSSDALHCATVRDDPRFRHNGTAHERLYACLLESLTDMVQSNMTAFLEFEREYEMLQSVVEEMCPDIRDVFAEQTVLWLVLQGEGAFTQALEDPFPARGPFFQEWYKFMVPLVGRVLLELVMAQPETGHERYREYQNRSPGGGCPEKLIGGM